MEKYCVILRHIGQYIDYKNVIRKDSSISFTVVCLQQKAYGKTVETFNLPIKYDK